MTRRSVLQFAAVVLIWGTTWIVIKDQLASVNPSWSIAYRFAIGGAALLAWCLWRGRPLRVPRAGLPFLAGLALAQFVLNFNFVYRAELHVPSGIVGTAYALLMVPNALLAWIFLKRGVTGRFAAGAVLGIAGVALLFGQQLALPGGDPAGVALGFALTAAGLLSASVANVMQATRRARTLPPLAALGWAMLMGAALNALVAAVVVGPPQWDPRPAYLAGLLFLGLLASAVAFALYFDLIRTIGPAEAAWTGVLVPIIAMTLSTLFEGYRWTPAAAAGALLAITGLAVALRQPRPAPA